MIIAVDFDGTCVTHEFPRVGAAEVLKELTDKGHKIILFTMRSHQLDGAEETEFIVSGGFGNAIMTMYGDRLTKNFGEVIVTNGGIRLGNEAAIFKDRLFCKN